MKSLPGKPDIVLPKYKAVVRVHGCYWHRHEGCRFTTTPVTRTSFWLEKFNGTIDRDRIAEQMLRQLEWRVFTVWECELRENPAVVVARLVASIRH